jgi:hypothetical protein
MSVMQPVRLLTKPDMDQLCINTIRTLSMDAVEQAKSGHPGTPMALAPLVYTLWNPAPLKELQRKFGFEPNQVVEVAKELLRRPQ